MNKKVMKLASRGKRLGAFAIDRVIPVILAIIMIASITTLATSSMAMYGYGYGYGFNSGFNAGSIAAIIVSGILYLVYLIVQLVFYTKSTTIGKSILGMLVVDTEKGEPIGIWKMLVREWFAKRASEVVFCLGYFWILIDDKNRAWHDKIMDTYVVDIKETAVLNASKQETSVGTDSDEIPETPTEAAVDYINETPEVAVSE